jgi:PKHD-type hydroxylase
MVGNEPVIEGRRKTAGRTHFWVSAPPIFSAAQCNLLKAIIDADNSPALVEGDSSSNRRHDARVTRIHWLNVDAHRWVYEIIWIEAHKANALFEFDVVPMRDDIQLALYDAQDKGHFRWHTDIIPSDLTRKISISVPLNNGTEYEGGDLEFHMGTTTRPPQIAGVPVMFPSWIVHRVTPVTAGKRYSLVAWLRGPNWR